MRLKENISLTDFILKVKECRSSVTFRSAEGDILALQSTLCQYIFSSLQAQPELLKNGLILCKDKADYKILEEFLLWESL